MNGQYARCYGRKAWQEGGELVDTSTTRFGVSGASSRSRRMQRGARDASVVATTLRRAPSRTIPHCRLSGVLRTW